MAGYRIKKDFNFSASHQLFGLPDDHPCSRLHGHNYVVSLELSSQKLNEIGFIEDYRNLDSIKRWIDDNLDHRHLNEVFACNPTAENIAQKLFDIFKKDFPQITTVMISETPKTWACYEG